MCVYVDLELCTVIHQRNAFARTYRQFEKSESVSPYITLCIIVVSYKAIRIASEVVFFKCIIFSSAEQTA